MIHSDATLGERLAEALYPVFGSSSSFVTDSPDLVTWLKTTKCNIFEYKGLKEAAPEYRENVVLLLTNEEAIPPFKELQALFRDSRVLIIPLTAFDPSLDVAIYTIERLSSMKFESAAKQNERWLKILLRHKEPLQLKGPGCDLVCAVDEVVYAMNPRTEVQMQPGDWDTISAYFEVGMVPQPEDFRPGYIVNGTLTVPGVVVAHHRQMNEALRPLPQHAWMFFQDLRGQNLFPLKMQIEDSRVTQVLAGDRDISSELTEFTNRKIDLMLMEMAFSTNEGVIPENIDWMKNAQVNEGALGIHVGLGDGLTGAHIDFICPGVQLQNEW